MEVELTTTRVVRMWSKGGDLWSDGSASMTAVDSRVVQSKEVDMAHADSVFGKAGCA